MQAADNVGAVRDKCTYFALDFEVSGQIENSSLMMLAVLLPDILCSLCLELLGHYPTQALVDAHAEEMLPSTFRSKACCLSM